MVFEIRCKGTGLEKMSQYPLISILYATNVVYGCDRQKICS